MTWLDRSLGLLGLQRKRAPRTAELLPRWQHNRPAEKEWDSAKAVKEGYKANVWAYACVDLKAKAVASVPWKAMVRPKLSLTKTGRRADEWEPAPTEPIQEFVEYPNPAMSRQDVFERLAQHCELGGNGIWTLIFGTSLRNATGKVPVEYWPLDPAYLRPIRHQQRFISGYEWMKDGVWINDPPIPANETLHFMYSDPANPYWGMSPLQAAARVVDTDIAAVNWNKMTFETRAIPEVSFTVDRPLTREEWEAIRAEVRDNYTGGRQPWVVGNGAKIEMLSWKPTEMDFIESRKLTREEICAAFHTPLPMVEVMADATLANMVEVRKKFWTDGCIPMLDNFRGVLNRVLVPMFGDRSGLMLDYDLSEIAVLREDMDIKSQVFERLVKNGIPPNVAIEMLDLDIDPIDGGEIGYLPATMTPMTMLGEVAEQALRMGEASIENTEAQTETTLKPPKDPNKTPKPAAPKKAA